MNKRILLSACLWLISLSVLAQVWNQLPDQLLSDKLELSARFLKNNSIGKMEIIHQEKHSNRPIVSSGLIESHFFDSQGRIVHYVQKNTEERILKEVRYLYSTQGLQSIRTKAGDRIVEQKFTLTDTVEKQVWLAWNVKKASIGSPTPSSANTIKEELIQRKDWNDTTTVVTFSHPDGRKIRREKTVKNAAGYILQHETVYEMGGKRQLFLFSYNAEGEMSSLTEMIDREVVKIKRFAYNEFGLLEEVVAQFRGKTKRKEMVYDDAFMPSGLLYKDEDVIYIKKIEVQTFAQLEGGNISILKDE